jgi:hypothetical protein
MENILICYEISSAHFHADTSGHAVEAPVNPLPLYAVFLSELNPLSHFLITTISKFQYGFPF